VKAEHAGRVRKTRRESRMRLTAVSPVEEGKIDSDTFADEVGQGHRLTVLAEVHL